MRKMLAEPTAEQVSEKTTIKIDVGVSAIDMSIAPDVFNEQVIISAALTDDVSRNSLLTRVPTDYFQAKDHRVIWMGLQELKRRNLKYDAATLIHTSREPVDRKYLIELEGRSLPRELNEHVAALTWDNTRLQGLRGPVFSLLKAIKDSKTSPERVQSLARQVGKSFDAFQEYQFLANPEALCQEVDAEITSRINGEGTFYPYGIEGFDHYSVNELKLMGTDDRNRIVTGSAPGCLTMLVGASGAGKSTVACNVVLAQVAMGKKVLFGTWEMGKKRTLELLAGIAEGIDRKKIKFGLLTEDERDRISKRMRLIAQNVLFFDNPFRRQRNEKASNEVNLDCIQKYIEASGCDVFVADLWKRCLAHTRPEDEEQAMYRQQAMASETRTHHILLHQLAIKDLEKRENPKPTRESVKGSSVYTEVPDTQIGIYNPALYKNVPNDHLQLLILKQREGDWPLAVEFEWDRHVGRIWGGRSIPFDDPVAVAENPDISGSAIANTYKKGYKSAKR